MNDIEKTTEYFFWIGDLKKRYRATQIKAAISVNTALLEFYWSLGKDINEKYPGKKRNAHFFAELSADLKIAIPESNGLSERNLQHILSSDSMSIILKRNNLFRVKNTNYFLSSTTC